MMIWKLQEFGGEFTPIKQNMPNNIFFLRYSHQTLYKPVLVLALILFTGLLEKDFRFFTYGVFFLRQIASREQIFAGTNLCEDSDFNYFAGIKFHEFC